MPAFHYQAYTAAGRTEAGVVEASSESEAVKLLNERGLLPFKTEVVGANDQRRSGWLAALLEKRLKLSDYAHVTRELAVLLNAGVPLDHALRLMADQATSLQMKRLAGSLVESVTAGTSLSAAFERHASDAPAYIVSLIRAGETRGSLGPALSDLSDFLYRRAANSARLQSALTYPSVLFITAFGAVSLIVAFLVPAITPIFEDSGVEPPLVLVLARLIGDYAAAFWPALLLLCCLTFVFAIHLLRQARIRLALDRVMLRLPIVGDVVSKTNLALLARTLGTLLRNGVALVPALNLTASVVPSRPFAAALRSAADRVREGQRLSVTIGASADLPKLLGRFVSIGEEASKLDDMLLHLADISSNDADRQFDRFMTLLPPLLTIVIGVIVGGLILSIMQAILSVNQLVLK